MGRESMLSCAATAVYFFFFFKHFAMGAAALTRIAADDSGFSCHVDLLPKCAGGAVGILANRLWNVPI